MTEEPNDASNRSPPMELLPAVAAARRMSNRMGAVRAEAASATFDGMLLEEQARGTPGESGDLVERGFALHLSGSFRLSPVAPRVCLEAAGEARASLPATWEAFHAGARGCVRCG